MRIHSLLIALTIATALTSPAMTQQKIDGQPDKRYKAETQSKFRQAAYTMAAPQAAR